MFNYILNNKSRKLRALFKSKQYLRVICNDQCILINVDVGEFQYTCIRRWWPNAVDFQHSYLVVKVL